MKKWTLLLALGCVACAPEGAKSPGKFTYDGYCATCHGATGQGDGPIAADLAVAPADLTQLSAMNGGTFPTEDVLTKIYGYPGRYHQAIMPEFGPVLEGAKTDWTSPSGEVIATPVALLELVTYLETLQE
ncbi:MAG: cytochrome C [Paracoccaceae bacterium]|nr:cytochrome C [Paracoccaceae bacterium]